ncbi:MAG: Ig-like domain-containing protein [Clostridia bacterium]|nr:Ig-like domain-containing protein [Clostridia bacterium]
MKNRWIATLLLLVLAVATLLPAAAVAEPVTLSLTLGVKETYQIKTSAISGAEDKQLVFATSNKKVATVSTDGVITAKKRGTAKIAVGYDDTALAVCTVTVLAAPKKISFADKALVISTGDTQQLTVTLPKKTASAITYESSDTAVATVDADGKVTAVSSGTAVVTAKTFNGKTAKCGVAVLKGKAPEKLSLSVENVSIQAKETFKLSPSVEEGADAIYAYASKNKKIATVSADGVITGRKKGTTQIAVKTHNGLTATVNVTVKGKLKELYGLLTDKPKTYLKYAKKLKLKKDNSEDPNSVMYYNGQVALIMTASSCQISLTPVANPKYCVQGIDASMTPEQAAAKLIDKGWALADAKTQDGVEIRAFTKDGDTTHYIVISADGSAIKSVDAVWSWKTDTAQAE